MPGKVKQVPVYLFTGFLEGGKTTFAMETLQDKNFNNGDRILLLICEEGLEEYAPDTFASHNVFTEVIEDESDLTSENLAAMLKKYRCSYVMVEYNGMWMLDSLYSNMPEGWAVAQEFMFVDSSTFDSYNANMRQLTVDKLKSCELVVFNRFTGNDDDKMRFHKIVRPVNRRCDIAFETPDHKISYDEIELPLPYDLSAPVVEIKDEDFAEFFQDLSENTQKYEGKILKLKMQAVTKARKLRPGYFFLGRNIMTCCANDVQFMPLAAEWKDVSAVQNMGWYVVTARMDLRNMPDIYRGTGPVWHVQSLEPTTAPEQEIATFY